MIHTPKLRNDQINKYYETYHIIERVYTEKDTLYKCIHTDHTDRQYAQHTILWMNNEEV